MRIHDFVRFRDIQQIQPQRVYLIVPAFSLPVPTWSGASTLIGEFPIGNSYWFTLRQVINKFGSNFVAAVRFVEDNIVTRFVLWEADDAIIHAPLYEGDVLGPGAVIELWSVNSSSAPVLTSNKVLETSVLVFQTTLCTSCCSNPNVGITLSLSPVTILPVGDPCNPFCEVPLVNHDPGNLPPPPPPVVPVGACCIGGVCSELTEADCLVAGGTYYGDHSVCSGVVCVPDFGYAPLPCLGYTEWGAIAMTDPMSGITHWVGIDPGMADPDTYIAAWPGCKAAWSAEVWRQFLLAGIPFAQAQLVWQNTALGGLNWQAIGVFPSGIYTGVISLNTIITVGYCPL